MADEQNKDQKEQQKSPEDQVFENMPRQNYLLKNGTTVAIDDYDEKVHGRIVEESDEQYRARIRSRYSARPEAALHPPTTIPNLSTIDATKVQPTAPVIPPTPAPSPSTATFGEPVTTRELTQGEKSERERMQKPSRAGQSGEAAAAALSGTNKMTGGEEGTQASSTPRTASRTNTTEPSRR